MVGLWFISLYCGLCLLDAVKLKVRHTFIACGPIGEQWKYHYITVDSTGKIKYVQVDVSECLAKTDEDKAIVFCGFFYRVYMLLIRMLHLIQSQLYRTYLACLI